MTVPITLRKNSYQETKMIRHRSQVPRKRGHSIDATGTTISKLLQIEKNLNIDLSNKPLFIGVSGGTASGKTSVCEMYVIQSTKSKSKMILKFFV